MTYAVTRWALGIGGWVVAGILYATLQVVTKAPDGLLDKAQVFKRIEYRQATVTQFVKVLVPVDGSRGVLAGQGSLPATQKLPTEIPRPKGCPPCWRPTAANLSCDCEWDVQQDANGFWGSTRITAKVFTPEGPVVSGPTMVKPKRVEILDSLSRSQRPVPWSLEFRAEAVSSFNGYAAWRAGMSIYGKSSNGAVVSYEAPLTGGVGRTIGVGYAHRFGRR